MKKINIKLTIPELQAIAIATAEHWIKIKDDPVENINLKSFPNNIPKNWKKLSEYLFAIYRINNRKSD